MGCSPWGREESDTTEVTLNDDTPPALTVEKIVDEVCRTFGVDSDDLRSQKSRRANINKPRQIGRAHV